MKPDYTFDLNYKDGRLQLLLVEVLERFYEYMIIDGTALVQIKRQDFREPWMKYFPDIEDEFHEILNGREKVKLAILHYKKAFDLLIGYIEAKNVLYENIERIENMYIRTIAQGGYENE